MKRQEFIQAVAALGLDNDDYVIIGSGALCMLGIRDVEDVDMVVSEAVFRRLETKGNWKRKYFEDGSYYITKGIYEIGMEWDGTEARPNLADLKKDELLIDGVPFVSLQRLKKWKLQKGREKDLKDIVLIDQYVAASKGPNSRLK